MESAVAVSDLDRAHRDARVIEALDEPQILDQWRPLHDAVRAATRRVMVEESLDNAAERVAEVGRACARCHEATNANVKFHDVAAPQAHATLAEDMRRHQWAGLEMWEGLIGPDDAAWRAGASALTAMPSNILATADDIDDVARIRLEASRALQMPTQDARTTLFGRILATCAHCHATLRDR
ncbi:MAG TPA: hypothetical protein VMJ10_06605 [Kofleriaceae bacterium]|nr:hypothetical protein [Kofleriaceae bacterium]